jgi:hypothetical protein
MATRRYDNAVEMGDEAAAAAAMPVRRMSVAQVAVDAIRHLTPLAPFYLLHGSITGYLLLTAFDLALGLMLIVGTTRDRRDPTSVDPRSRLPMARLAAILVIAAFFAVVSAIVALPISAPAIIFGLATGVDWHALLTSRAFVISVACMSLLAAARGQFAFEANTTPGEKGPAGQAAPVIGNLEQDRGRSLAAYAAQVTLIATFALLSFLLLNFGRAGFQALPVLYAALLVFYDARPDIAQRIFPAMWRTARR